MRNSLVAVPLVAVLVAFMAFRAQANEFYLGTVSVTDAGTGTNAVWNFTALDAGFAIGPGQKLSIQPDGGAYVCIDSHVMNGGQTTCSSTTGVLVPGGALFPSSCSSSGATAIVTENTVLSDGGISGVSTRTVQRVCSVACVPQSGAVVGCTVFGRAGTEN